MVISIFLFSEQCSPLQREQSIADHCRDLISLFTGPGGVLVKIVFILIRALTGTFLALTHGPCGILLKLLFILIGLDQCAEFCLHSSCSFMTIIIISHILVDPLCPFFKYIFHVEMDLLCYFLKLIPRN